MAKEGMKFGNDEATSTFNLGVWGQGVGLMLMLLRQTLYSLSQDYYLGHSYVFGSSGHCSIIPCLIEPKDLITS